MAKRQRTTDAARPGESPRLGIADEGVQREQIEHTHQRFEPLIEIRHALRVQRMNDPNDGDSQRHARRRRTETSMQPRRLQRAPRDAEQRAGRRDVDRQVRRVPTRQVIAVVPREQAELIVQRERDVADRPRLGEFETAHQGGQSVRIGFIRKQIVRTVEHERRVERIGVGQQSASGDEQRSEGSRPAFPGVFVDARSSRLDSSTSTSPNSLTSIA